ncbi:MAG TPA: isoprenylcysteine carboxylmethyltransferase family protein [Steroidobacteraceae bacterium]|nr:isoprenylcysteine carboxylmethyltransferase family protein [Steroidobacteraceae bacterium]
MLRRAFIFIYGLASYAVFFATFLYAIGFIGNFLVPRSIDGVPQVGLIQALLVDLGLLMLFAVQHSVMARPAFKRVFTRLIPESAERSTYVLASSAALIALFYYWQPIGGQIWNVTDPTWRGVLYGVYAFGWLLLLYVTFLINHFDLFGLRQVWLELVDRPYTDVGFKMPALYRLVRHPLYIGWLVIFWATPSMSATHLLFAIATTGYILVAIQLEEHDLEAQLGADYRDYKRRVPMLIPFTKRGGGISRDRREISAAN